MTIPACPPPVQPTNPPAANTSVPSPTASDPCNTHLWETMPAYNIVRKYLISILLPEICENTHPQIFDLHETPHSIVDEFHCQFTTYVLQEPPFLCTPGMAPWDYWKKLLKNESASILTVSLYLPVTR